MDLHGKTAIVTGASSGIGWMTAKLLAAYGANLILTARRAERLRTLEEEIVSGGGQAAVVVGDATFMATAQQTVAAALNTFGHIDILVNNAGYAPPTPLTEMTENIWDITLNSCLKSMYLMTHNVIPTMLQAGAGRIVQISSIAGKHGYANRTAYCAAKWGMQGFSEALREEVRGQGIRVHTIHPAEVATDWWSSTNDPQPNKILDRMMLAEDVANAVVWVLTQPDHLQINEVVLNNFCSPWVIS